MENVAYRKNIQIRFIKSMNKKVELWGVECTSGKMPSKLNLTKQTEHLT